MDDESFIAKILKRTREKKDQVKLKYWLDKMIRLGADLEEPGSNGIRRNKDQDKREK